jgi:hypothetical protein
MKLKTPKNLNYCASIVEIVIIVPLANCDNVTSTIIDGFPVIIPKTTKLGDVGVYFPPETQLSEQYCFENNLYRHGNLNKDQTKTGYIEENRRVRTVKFRGNQSAGLFLPLDSLTPFAHLSLFTVGTIFDEIDGQLICQKYNKKQHHHGPENNKKKKKHRKSKILDHQFRFHVDTANLGRNIHRIQPDDIITITKKVHGTSVVCSRVLCKKPLSIRERIAKFFGVSVVETCYDNVFSSRKVIKNDYVNPDTEIYALDIWGLANDTVKHALRDGLTVYAEIVGYTPTGRGIQSVGGKAFDYGCEKGTFKVYIYRVTYTSPAGDVFEFSSKQLQTFCNEHGLLHVPEYYHGTAKDLCNRFNHHYNSETFNNVFLNLLQELYLEKDCPICSNKIPDEGIVVRKEGNTIEAYKLKSIRFLEGETKEIDKGNSNIEDEN